MFNERVARLLHSRMLKVRCKFGIVHDNVALGDEGYRLTCGDDVRQLAPTVRCRVRRGPNVLAQHLVPADTPVDCMACIVSSWNF